MTDSAKPYEILPADAIVPAVISARSLESRKLIAVLLHNANGCQRAKLIPARDAKLDAILDCLSVLQRSVAFLLDADLVGSGEKPEIRFMQSAEGGNGADKASPLVTP